jgi:4-amino-4-deoxy-L-arabinose transferase-like glycosyltransferase
MIAILIVLLSRLLGPGDLFEKDQPKTTAYTADILLNGQFALPRDMISQPATKPPLYNWVAAGVVGATGSWSEVAQKSPSLIGLGMMCGSVFLLTRRRDRGVLACALLLTYGVDVVHGSTIRLMFLARPDMLQAGFLSLGWAAATLLVLRGGARWSILLWTCFAGAALTKGPMALLLIVYLAMAMVVLRPRDVRVPWRATLIGFSLSMASVLLWFWVAYRVDPHHVRGVMLGAEIADRITQQSPEGFTKPVYDSVMWFFTKGGIASVIALVGAILFWRRSAIARAATLWMIVILVALSLPAGKRMDYLLPAYAPASLLAAMLLMRLRSRWWWMAALLPVMLATVLAVQLHRVFPEAVHHYTDNAKQFAADVRAYTRDDVLVLVPGKHPLQLLLRQHQGSYVSMTQLREAKFVVVPVVEGIEPIVRSVPIPCGFDVVTKRELMELGLYDERLPIDKRIEAAERMNDWDTTKNPYRAPETVWRADR